MRRGKDISIELPGALLIHQNIPGKEVDTHSHPEHILFIPLSGEIALNLAQGRLDCGPGRMIYLPSECTHAFDSSHNEGERLIALIDDKLWKRLGGTLSRAMVLMSSQLIKELFFYLLVNPESKHKTSVLMVLVQTLTETLEAGSDSAIASDQLEARALDPRVKKALSFMRENATEDLSMLKAAEASGLSLRSLNRLFLEGLGQTPKKILTYYRIEKAQELLTGTDGKRRTVTEVAFEVGYNSLAQFIKAFRLSTGQLPSEFARFGQKAQFKGQNP